MRENGSTLAEILAAGEWRAAASPLRCVGSCRQCPVHHAVCISYLDTSRLERDAVFEIAINSDHEEWIN